MLLLAGRSLDEEVMEKERRGRKQSLYIRGISRQTHKVDTSRMNAMQVSGSGRMLMQSMHWEIIGQLVLALCKSKRSLMSREILVRLLLSSSVELFW